MSKNPFKVGDVVVAKQGCAKSTVSSVFNVQTGVSYEVTAVGFNSISLLGGPDRANSDRFELAPGSTPVVPESALLPCVKYGYFADRERSACGFASAGEAVDHASNKLVPGERFEVVKYTSLGKRKVVKSSEVVE
jgi:hypothetical protein